MAGLRACMLSNSWGHDAYPREVFDGMFDAVVISAQVGMRKPEERIYRHATELIGLPPAECVFVDDMEANVRAAEALGMCGIVHTQPEATVARLAELFGLPLG
jgi:putative hydrolase of the HAD superfamily